MSAAGNSAERDTLLRARLAAVRTRVALGCEAAGRRADEVTLLAVTKGAPAADVIRLADLGLAMFGESRVQEATSKAADVAELRPAATLRWHLVGRLQRNKVRAVAGWAARVESVDSERLADALDAAVLRAAANGPTEATDWDAASGAASDLAAAVPAIGGSESATRPDGRLPVLLQLSLDGDPTRGGVPPEDLLRLADHIAGCAGLELTGVMAIAPASGDPDAAFARLAGHAARLRAEHPTAMVISAGMSGDLESAIRHGSTCVRVGTALVGSRPLVSE